MDTQVGTEEEFKLNEGTKKISALVVNDVKVIEREMYVDKPKYIDKEQIKYNTKIENTTKYKVVEKDTIKYNVNEKDTIKYSVVVGDTTKYNVKVVDVERPLVTDKAYERPVIVNKDYEVITIKDLDKVKELVSIIPKLICSISDIHKEIDGLRKYKLVEEILKVPKVKYMPREEERIVWKDVPRERCKHCTKEI